MAEQQSKLDEMIGLIDGITREEGRIKTIIPFLTIVRNTQQTPPIPSVLTPSFCLILQGTKRLQFAQDIVDCQPGNFLASVINMPTSAQVMGASRLSPYMGLRMDLTTKEIASPPTFTDNGEYQTKPPSLTVGPLSPTVEERLLRRAA